MAARPEPAVQSAHSETVDGISSTVGLQNLWRALPDGAAVPAVCERLPTLHLRQRKAEMKKKFIGPAIAGLVLIGSASTASATTAPSEAPTQVETDADDDGSNAGLWGLLGLAGLAGLAGLKRRDRHPTSDRSATSVRT